MSHNNLRGHHKFGTREKNPPKIMPDHRRSVNPDGSANVDVMRSDLAAILHSLQSGEFVFRKAVRIVYNEDGTEDVIFNVERHA